MDLEAPNIAYAPPYDASGQFDDALYPEALYKALRALQQNENEEPTAKLNIGYMYDGTLTLRDFSHPYCGGPIEIGVSSIGEESEESRSDEIDIENGRPTDAWDAPGITATLEVEDSELLFLIPESSGRLCMRPLWKSDGVDEDGKVMELFEGKLDFQCAFNRVAAKRAGNGVDETLVFWAVRGKA